ncbi:MAG: hypothetical protein IJ702_03970, partial [Fretibacterium sp.]|nr:hypothetical protein [Fretibacterium sp.]
SDDTVVKVYTDSDDYAASSAFTASVTAPATNGSSTVYRFVVTASDDYYYVTELKLTAGSGSGEGNKGDEGDTPLDGEPQETKLTKDEVEKALSDVGISIPSDATILTSSKDIEAASVDRGAGETTATVGNTAKSTFTSDPVSYLPEGVASVDVSTVKPVVVLPRYKFDKKTVAVFDIPLKGVKLNQILMWIATVVNSGENSSLVVLNADDLAGGEAQFIRPDTKAVVDKAWEADPTVTVAACFDANTTYDPVILAATEAKTLTSDKDSGGCDLGLGGVALLLAALLPLAKKR